MSDIIHRFKPFRAEEFNLELLELLVIAYSLKYLPHYNILRFLVKTKTRNKKQR